MPNKSLEHEFEFIHYLNNKKYSELSDKWKNHIKRMFPEVIADSVIHCNKHENYFAKGDIDIRIKNNRKIISLKCGSNACMHRERFRTFYHYLKDLGVSDFTLSVLTLYQFGECKTFGHIDKPLSKNEIVEQYSELIFKANQELNKENILDAVIERSVIKGCKEYRQEIDYFYYGNLNKGLLISVDQIYQSIKSRHEIACSWIHFGQLVFQPGARKRTHDDYLESTIRWPVLGKLFYIATDENNILDCNIDG